MSGLHGDHWITHEQRREMREQYKHRQWYFAYGSNLSTVQKEHSTGPIREARRAHLNGYRIAFNKRSNDGSGKANIVKHGSGTIWGVLYLSSPSALDEMDKFEEVPHGHYRRSRIRVRLHYGDEIEAVTYVAGDSFLDDSLEPDPEYLKTILQSAHHHSLPEYYIREIESAAY